MDIIQSWGFSNIGNYIIVGIGLNFIIELVINIILGPMILRLIKQGKK